MKFKKKCSTKPCQFDLWREKQKELFEWQRSNIVWLSCTCPKCQIYF